MKRLLLIFVILSSIPVFANDPSEKQIEGYYELLDLYKIEPNWPGLEELIVEAEIIIGLRLPVISPEHMRKSDELVEDAKRLLSTITIENEQGILRRALSIVNQSLKYNPKNKEALQLREEILDRLIPDKVIVLPPHLEVEYKKAEKEYLQGNIYIAYQIVLKYEENETMMGYTEFRKLRKRIYIDLGLRYELY